MRAIDTNVVVRYLTSDHPRQSKRARRLVDGGETFVSTTVLLEVEWVLRSVYEFPAADVLAALRSFAGLPGVTVEETALVATALDCAERGMDFADALHLGKAAHCDEMLTFDRRFVRAARAAGIDIVREA